MDEMISEKNDFCDGSSSSSKTVCQNQTDIVGPTLRVLVAQSRFSHVRELDGSLGARIHEEVAVDGVELGGRDDFGELLHVDGLDVDNVWWCQLVRTRVDTLKLWSLMLRFHKLIRRSSADMYVSPSEFTEIELMW